jgi:hypothetical protein
MKICILAVFLAVAALSPSWAATLGEAEGRVESATSATAAGTPPWKHKFGLRCGLALFSDSWWSVFYENQLDGHWAIRPSIEFMASTRDYLSDPMDLYATSANIDRAGVAIDCIYYVFGRWRSGMGPYLMAGLGVHTIDMKDQDGTRVGYDNWIYKQSSGTVPALSVGLGFYRGRYVGLEYKRHFSTLDTPVHGNLGKNWTQVTLNLRFPVPGLPRGGW